MHAKQILHNLVSTVARGMHATRRRALEAVVEAALIGTTLTVTGLGRAMTNTVAPRYCIKRADRLVANGHLHRERKGLYEGMAGAVLQGRRRALIVVDWSDLNPEGSLFLLRAAVPVGGRTLTIYEEVHTRQGKEKPAVHRAFLARLAGLLPAQCQPIIVTDAGFRTPWFKQVESQGWDWIGRIRHRHHLRATPDGQWVEAKRLYAQASRRAKALGTVMLTRSNPIECQLVLVRQKARGRHRQTRRGQRCRSGHSQQQAARAREPWLLATSLKRSSKLAKRVVKLTFRIP